MKKDNNREVDPIDFFTFLLLAGVLPMLILLELSNHPSSFWPAVWLIGGIAWHFMIKEVIIPTIKKLLEIANWRDN